MPQPSSGEDIYDYLAGFETTWALNLPHKTKDGLKARQDLEALGIKTELRPQPKGDRHWLPPAKQHMLELKDLNPRRARKSTWLQSQHSRTFITWFKKEVEKRLANEEDICDDVRWLAKGPNFAISKYSGFAINEYHFHTTSRDESRTTQCSGVSLVAYTMQIASAKDSNPVYGVVTYFGRIKELWDLDYRMFTMLD
ncbi:unnamed protein product [Lactuca virosa]|uniref:Uncharacterized protein n=1 Tax=Lactuca virosa TaxID=75947 RepID=A0AAU9M379_9ASTR|nr:unnamed protein product [Lactuca virosa]